MNRSLLVLAMLAVLASACGPRGDEPEPGSGATAPPPPPALASAAADPALGPTCEQVRRTITETLSIPTDLRWTAFQHPLEETSRTGCEITAVGDLESAPPPGQPGITLVAALRRAGWETLPRYDADGVDGYSGAVRRRVVLCFHYAEWQGPLEGSDEPDRAHALPEYRLRVQCARDEPASTAVEST